MNTYFFWLACLQTQSSTCSNIISYSLFSRTSQFMSCATTSHCSTAENTYSISGLCPVSSKLQQSIKFSSSLCILCPHMFHPHIFFSSTIMYVICRATFRTFAKIVRKTKFHAMFLDLTILNDLFVANIFLRIHDRYIMHRPFLVLRSAQHKVFRFCCNVR